MTKRPNNSFESFATLLGLTASGVEPIHSNVELRNNYAFNSIC